MTRNTYGNAGKGIARCRACQNESVKPRVAPWETLVMMSCHFCGENIILRPDLWDKEGA